MVNDPSRVTARGDGLSLVQCGQQASFTINAPGAQLRDIDVRVTCASPLALLHIYFLVIFFTLPFSELRLVGLALDLVD